MLAVGLLFPVSVFAQQNGGGGHDAVSAASSTSGASAVMIDDSATAILATAGLTYAPQDNSSLKIEEDPQRQLLGAPLPGTVQPMGYFGSALDKNLPPGWFPIESGTWEEVEGDMQKIEYESPGDEYFRFKKDPTRSVLVLKKDEVVLRDGKEVPMTSMGTKYIVLKSGQVSTAGEEILKAKARKVGADVVRIWLEEDVEEVASTAKSDNSGAGLSVLLGLNQLAGVSGAYGHSATSASLKVPKKIRVNAIFYSL
ncbi:MAG: hypothetical protein M0P97_03875 [Candidatus Moranbacteria bacterium]|nr:hypothetical protein [Candidatus Moranbacteria bacterium]